MQMKTLCELAEHVGGKIIGDPEVLINSVATIANANEGQISFLSNIKYTKFLKTTKASAVIVNKEVETSAKAQLISDDPYYAFCQIVELIFGHRKHKDCGISSKAEISETASVGENTNIHQFATISDNVKVGNNCNIYPGVFIGPGTTIGDGCIIYPNAVIFENCVIGNGVIIQANATVGQDGFGFATHNGEHHKIPHISKVIVEDNAELGANCAIERGSLQDTIIGRGSKIGDAVTIGHGAKIGAGCLLVPQVGIAGTAELGQYCVLGGQSAVVGHIKVGNMVMAAGKSAITNNVEDGKILAGSPAIEAGKAKRAYTMIEKLPEFSKRIKALEKELATLKNEIN